jgi:hypothetical protein
MAHSEDFGNQPEFAQFGGERHEDKDQPTERGASAGSEGNRVIEINRPSRARQSQPETPRTPFDESIAGQPQNYVDTLDETALSGRKKCSHQEIPSPLFERNFEDSRPGAPGDFSGRSPKGYRRSDQRIYEDTCEALTRDPRVDPSNVEVTVQDGEVALAGTVENVRMLRVAEDLSAKVAGVRKIRNGIQVEERKRAGS